MTTNTSPDPLRMPFLLLLLSAGVSVSQDSQPRSESNSAGVPGVPGSPGRNGSPGRDERDGFKGGTGERGLPGARGFQGERGDNGLKGVAGEKGERGAAGRVGSKGNSGKLGPQGPVGMKGMKGEWGEKGSKGSKGETFQVNWRQCVWTDDDDTDAGKIRECQFKKYYNNSALHVVYSGVNRVACSNNQGCCSRWFFTFNGSECSTPANIDLIVFKWHTVDNPFRTRQMTGYCENLPSGNAVVALHVGRCTRWSNSVDNAHTGLSIYPSRILVTETSAPQQQ